MKMRIVLMLLTGVAMGWMANSWAAPTAITVEPAAPVALPTPAPAPKETLLEQALRCADEVYPDRKGAGDNPLRYDSLSLRPHYSDRGEQYEPSTEAPTRWLVHIGEEHPHRTIPSGAEFMIDTRRGSCSNVGRD